MKTSICSIVPVPLSAACRRSKYRSFVSEAKIAKRAP